MKSTVKRWFGRGILAGSFLLLFFFFPLMAIVSILLLAMLLVIFLDKEEINGLLGCKKDPSNQEEVPNSPDDELKEEKAVAAQSKGSEKEEPGLTEDDMQWIATGIGFFSGVILSMTCWTVALRPILDNMNKIKEILAL